jgi:hypothetical protein
MRRIPRRTPVEKLTQAEAAVKKGGMGLRKKVYRKLNRGIRFIFYKRYDLIAKTVETVCA